uniref:Transposase (Putative), gypsy type n=1 Tax=Tanacetum cinerariifolium TaxID=118510 RepID=A0A6L2M2P7_TANCI|nr:hypothetical protein [Tanacetum cinerariifolium]
MDLYLSRLTQDNLNDLIIKYKIPHDLHSRLPLEEYVMSELSENSIGIYHQMFDVSGVRILFALFLLALIKHYRVYFSQLGPLDLNKFLHEAMEERIFLIDRQAISDSMVWRHPDVAIDDPWPAVGSFSMADMRRLSAHVINLRDISEGVLVLSGLSRVWKSRVCDMVLWGADGNVMGIYDFLCLSKWTDVEVQEEPYLDVRSTLQRLPFYCTPPATADAVILDPTSEDLTVGTPNSKILAKVEASHKRKASTSGATSSHAAKRTRMRVGALLLSLLKVLTPEGKGIMANDVATPSIGASQPRPSFGPAPSLRDVSGDAIHADFFPFSAGPYHATYPQDGIARNCEFTCEEWDVLYRPTFGVLTKEIFKDPIVSKAMVEYELLASYHGLVPSHHEYVQSVDSRLKGYEERVHGVAGLELQVSTLKKQVFGLNDKLVSSNTSFAKSKAKGKERKKKIKSHTKSLDNLHVKVARLSAALNQATMLEAEKDEEILRLKATPLKFASFFCGQFQDLVQKFFASDEFSKVQGKLPFLAASAGFKHGLSMNRTKDEFVVVLKKMANFMPGAQDRLAEASPLDPRVSPPITKESIVTPASKSLELSTYADLTHSVVASKHDDEMVNAKVDGMLWELVVLGSGCASSCPNDVVVALSAGEKGDGLVPSFDAGEDVAANPLGV